MDNAKGRAAPATIRADSKLEKVRRVLVAEGALALIPRTVRYLFHRLWPGAEGRAPEQAAASRRLPQEKDFALEVPFAETALSPTSAGVGSVAAVIHAYHAETCGEIVDLLRNVPFAIDCYISTDTESKKRQIEAAFAPLGKGTVEVRLFPNRGRDITPKLVGMADVYGRYEFVLHLHSKQTPHGKTRLAGWRSYLFRTLLGSPQTVRSIFEVLLTTDVGLVFPQHFFPVRVSLDWGHNFARTQQLLARAGVAIGGDELLEFPSGSMFWCRSAALRKLLDLNLSFDDFEPESGQVDGTFAHAVERAYLYLVEAAGFRWAKVAIRARYPTTRTVLPVDTLADIETALAKAHHRLIGTLPGEMP